VWLTPFQVKSVLHAICENARRGAAPRPDVGGPVEVQVAQNRLYSPGGDIGEARQEVKLSSAQREFIDRRVNDRRRLALLIA
jgi:hypothetical protein